MLNWCESYSAFKHFKQVTSAIPSDLVDRETYFIQALMLYLNRRLFSRLGLVADSIAPPRFCEAVHDTTNLKRFSSWLVLRFEVAPVAVDCFTWRCFALLIAQLPKLLFGHNPPYSRAIRLSTLM